MEWPEAQFDYVYDPSNPTIPNMNAAPFDASYIVNETLALWLDPNNMAQAPDLSAFGFTFDANTFGDLQVPSSTESSGSSVASTSSSPAMEKAQVAQQASVALTPQAPPSIQLTRQPQPMAISPGNPQLSGNQQIDELTQRAMQLAGVSVALPMSMEVADANNSQGRKSQQNTL